MARTSDPTAAVAVVDLCGVEPSARWAMGELRRALVEAGAQVSDVAHWTGPDDDLLLVAGLTTDRRIERLALQAGPLRPATPEGVVIRRCPVRERDGLVVAGTDARGLTYALVEVADRLTADGLAALTPLDDVEECPDNRVRGVDRFVMGHLDDEWFYSEPFWQYYFARLARARYNRFTLVTGFDTAYMSPPYPYFVQVDEFPRVGAVGVDSERREANLAQLRQIGRLAHDHGLEFVFGTWQQTPWTRSQDVLVEGLPEDEAALGTYCAGGLRALIDECTEIDVVHFRVNHEAGVGSQQTNEAFWRDCIDGVAAATRPVKLDLRAKGLTDDMIQYALSRGLDVSVPTKYWCEHAGLPHHLTQMRGEELGRLDNLNHSRRYSYSDMLRKPRDYDLIYRLWNMGSSCLFLWGDPDYARRFSASCAVGDAAGFQIAAPLSLKGGHELAQRDPWPIHSDGAMRHYEWEDERYWFWYLAFGRMGYSRATSDDVWRRECRRRFGADGAAVVQALYRAASRVLPFVTAAHMPVHPLLCYWTELDTGGPLFAEHNHHAQRGGVTYANSEPSDPGLFYRIDEYVADLGDGAVRGKYTPMQVSAWLDGMAAEVRAGVDAADNITTVADSAEYAASRVDFTMLAELADYHAQKMLAAVALETHLTSEDADSLTLAHAHAAEALGHWGALADLGASAFHAPLDFSAGAGYGRTGTWSDRTHELEKDVARLVAMLGERGAVTPATPIGTRVPRPWDVDAAVPDTASPGQDARVTLRTTPNAAPVSHVTMHCRRLNQLEGAFERVEMAQVADGYSGAIPGEYVSPEWDLLVYFSAVDERGEPLLYPGLYSAVHDAPYFLIEVAP
ncbi:hypothetical protein HN371_01770 [Candidatus Poribacteria bacterium]|jgi:hypothetical protein|nr:hypothetical protein [Candidatus Poribacteria bacterium]MBT5534598.1 hypothetical protein [Candidatus Poribacteria bacterium]MBT7807725.1 hypothetical protein [Candidatus Poribacteria bacterium]